MITDNNGRPRQIDFTQWWANPNPDLATFVKSGGFGLDLNFFGGVDWI